MERHDTDPQKEQEALEESVTLTREQIELAMGCTSMVYSLAWEMHNNNPLLDIDEALSDGNFGLLQAASKYDQDRSSFSGYAYSSIRWSILNGLRARLGPNLQKPSSLNPHDRSLDAPLSPDSDITLGEALDETLTDVRFTTPEGIITLVDVQRAIAALPTRQREAILCFMQGNTTTAEIARELGVSQPRASQLFRSAAAKVRELASLPPPLQKNAEKS